MNKQKFTKIVKEYHSISADDRNKLHELAGNYPYSQVIHTLVAKANIDANTNIAKQTLGYAAMYSADRSVLKDIIASKQKLDDHKPAAEETPVTDKVKTIQEPAEEKEKKSSLELVSKVNEITIDPAILKSGEPRLSDTVMKDLYELKQSKASYLEWLKLPDDNNDEPSAEKEKPVTKRKSRTTKASKTTKASNKTQITKKKDTEAKAKPTKAAKAPSKKTASKPAKSTTSKKSAQKKRDSQKPKADNKDDQIKIIEKFIEKEPSITAKASRKSPENQEDLSIASTSFNEDLVSENLAKILISQGKSDKAVDIYKKLIWKFPQKKAYFASQIEELKKNK